MTTSSGPISRHQPRWRRRSTVWSSPPTHNALPCAVRCVVWRRVVLSSGGLRGSAVRAIRPAGPATLTEVAVAMRALLAALGDGRMGARGVIGRGCRALWRPGLGVTSLAPRGAPPRPLLVRSRRSAGPSQGRSPSACPGSRTHRLTPVAGRNWWAVPEAGKGFYAARPAGQRAWPPVGDACRDAGHRSSPGDALARAAPCRWQRRLAALPRT